MEFDRIWTNAKENANIGRNQIDNGLATLRKDASVWVNEMRNQRERKIRIC
jgi:hypothetical protein